MSSASDLELARQVFVQALDADEETANRIADFIYDFYAQRALGKTAGVVLHAATWAAQQLNALPVERRLRVSREQIRAQLERDDCPLCLGGSDDNRGSTSGGTPVIVPTFEGVNG